MLNDLGFFVGIQEKNLAGVFQLLFPVLCYLLIRKLVHVPMCKVSPHRDSAKGDGSKARRSGQCLCSHSKQSLKDFCFLGMKNSTLYSYKTLYVRSLPLWFSSSSYVSWSEEVSWWEWIGFFCWAVALMSEQLKGNHRISWDQYFLYTLRKKGNMPTHTSNVYPTSDHNHLRFWRDNSVGTFMGLRLLVLGSIISNSNVNNVLFLLLPLGDTLYLPERTLLITHCCCFTGFLTDSVQFVGGGWGGNPPWTRSFQLCKPKFVVFQHLACVSINLRCLPTQSPLGITG